MADLTNDHKYLLSASQRLRVDSERLRADITYLEAEIIRLKDIGNKLRERSNKLIAYDKQLSDDIAKAISKRELD
jgi:hypothetical protein